MNPAGEHTTFVAVPRGPQADVAALAREGWRHVAPEVSAVAAKVARDVHVAYASGRWRPGSDDPASYLPGDAVALRAFTLVSDFEWLGQLQEVLADPSAQPGARVEAAFRTRVIIDDARTLYDAVPHFLDADVAAGILASRPPGPDVVDELRLPHRSVAVFLGRVFEVAPEQCDWPPEWDHTVDLAGRARMERTILGELRARGGGIEGVVLTEAPEGGLADEVLWVVSTVPNPERPGGLARDRLRSVVWGRRSRAHLAGVAENLAAAVACGEWREARPVTLPKDPGSRQWSRAVRRGEFRRREPHGGAGGVRVLDLARSAVAQPRTVASDGAGADRASPVTHLRRAHWRLQPVGRGGAERRLTRVAATVVCPGATPMRTTVYRVPAPEAPPAEPDPEPAPPTPTGGSGIDLRHLDLAVDPQGGERPTPRRSGAGMEL
jgi:hypothetical protein